MAEGEISNFFRKKLKNGMTVVMEKRELPIVVIGIANRFGGSFEKSEYKGVAHVLEHVLFNGTEKRSSEEISREVEKKGGILNAFTAHEITCFWFKMPSEHAFTGLEILSDILINSKLDKEKFEKEKKVILEEIKMYHDDPASDIFNEIEANLYKSPFGDSIIGNEKSVSALERDFVYDILKNKYNPSNYIVSVVGDVDFKKVCEFLDKKFKSNGNEYSQIEIVKENAETSESRDGIDQAHFVLGFHAPLPSEKEHYALKIMNAYLTYGMSSRLWNEIREKRGLAYAVKGVIQAEKNYSYYAIYVGTKKEKIEEVKKIILEEIEKISEMSEKNLKEAKETIRGLRKIGKEESSNVMEALMYSELAGKAEDYYDFENKIDLVKLADVKQLAKKMKEKYSSAAIVPK